MEETLEQMQARHRKELRDLQGRITNKKKNATKKTRKFVNDECAELERQTRERHEEELRRLMGEVDGLDGQDERQADHELQQLQQDGTEETVNTLADKLDSTSLSSQPPQQPQPPAQQQKQEEKQPKQKRNRQKERLARRQAEQEAAALAAESEAANMTDHRGLEREAMARTFAAHALREHEIAPDGHCLFSAVADQLGVLGIPLSGQSGSGAGAGADLKEGGKGKSGEDGLVNLGEAVPKVAPYRVVRRAAAEYILQHKDEYAGFIEEEGGVEAYVSKIRDTAEWGGQLELSALANAYGVEIRVVQGGSRVEVVSPTSGDAGNGDGNGEEKEKKTVWLAYYRHGYGLGEHYNSLRRTG